MSSLPENFPLHWPAGWPRTPVLQRKPTRFHAKERSRTGTWMEKKELTIYAAMRRLTDELSALGATAIVLSSNVETRNDGQPRSDRRPPGDTGVACYFQLARKPRVLACDRWDSVAGNIAAIAGHIDAIRRQERYGVGTLDQAFAGFTALPPPGERPKRHWRDVFMFNPGEIINAENLPNVRARYVTLSKERHPDRGGSADQMAELNVAWTQAKAELGG